MPDVPDLAAVPDGRLNAFLQAALVGEPVTGPDRIRLLPVAEVWDNLSVFDPDIHEAPDHESWPCIPLANGDGFEPLSNLLTSWGAVTIIEAMGMRGEWFHVDYSPPRPLQPAFRPVYLARFSSHRTMDGVSIADRFPRAVAQAASVGLYPTASSKARALLAVTQDA